MCITIEIYCKQIHFISQDYQLYHMYMHEYIVDEFKHIRKISYTEKE